MVAIDRRSWIVINGQRLQTHCRLLLCQFHAKKSWVDNLLPKVSATERSHLYQRMCQLMQCITKSAFNAMCEELKVEYAEKPGVWQYIGGWCGLTCVEESLDLVECLTMDMLTLPILWKDIGNLSSILP